MVLSFFSLLLIQPPRQTDRTCLPPITDVHLPHDTPLLLPYPRFFSLGLSSLPLFLLHSIPPLSPLVSFLSLYFHWANMLKSSRCRSMDGMVNFIHVGRHKSTPMLWIKLLQSQISINIGGQQERDPITIVEVWPLSSNAPLH